MAQIVNVVTGGPMTAWELARGLAADGVTARIVRGSKAHTRPALFDEFAASLQFPPYFGHNWDAFDECLSSLDEIAPGPWAVIVTDADQVLCDASARDRAAFASCLAGAQSEAGVAVYFATRRPPAELTQRWSTWLFPGEL